ncbi:hypothetical protein WJX73_010407 [Symbiochloris irregularis]|uniref:B box-type domain-containing protein n=1 Tax=Symbiochloris irregularis TaxID=706552 RepID=A0AAW1NT65_9CHLO
MVYSVNTSNKNIKDLTDSSVDPYFKLLDTRFYACLGQVGKFVHTHGALIQAKQAEAEQRRAAQRAEEDKKRAQQQAETRKLEEIREKEERQRQNALWDRKCELLRAKLAAEAEEKPMKESAGSKRPLGDSTVEQGSSKRQRDDDPQPSPQLPDAEALADDLAPCVECEELLCRNCADHSGCGCGGNTESKLEEACWGNGDEYWGSEDDGF